MKIISYILIAMLLLSNCLAYGGGAGYIYSKSSEIKNRASLNHINVFPNEELIFECGDKYLKKQSVGLTKIIKKCSKDETVVKINMKNEDDKVTYFDVYTITEDKYVTEKFGNKAFKIYNIKTNGKYPNVNMEFKLPEGKSYKLYHQKENGWEFIKLKFINNVNGFDYYTSSMNNFSIYVITEEEKVLPKKIDNQAVARLNVIDPALEKFAIEEEAKVFVKDENTEEYKPSQVYEVKDENTDLSNPDKVTVIESEKTPAQVFFGVLVVLICICLIAVVGYSKYQTNKKEKEE